MSTSANEGTAENPDNRVSFIDDAKRLEIVATHEVGSGAHGVSVDGGGRFVFVTNIHDDTLSVIDVEAGRSLPRMQPVGGRMAWPGWLTELNGSLNQVCSGRGCVVGGCGMG